MPHPELNDIKNVAPRTLARAAEYMGSETIPSAMPGRGPVAMPVGMPSPGGPGGYSRYREMTLEEMLLENRVVFLVGEINHVSASRVIMQMLYLQRGKPARDINPSITTPAGASATTLGRVATM